MAFEAAWGMEAILTFALVFMVFAATDNFHAMTTAHLPVSSKSLPSCAETPAY
jgi:glycerol uptake facilitator-like aquaporin